MKTIKLFKGIITKQTRITAIFYQLVTIIVITTIGIAKPVNAVQFRVKSAPDVYQYSPESLPQIPLNAFYTQHYENYVDPLTGLLNVTHQDFALPIRDKINFPIKRYYNSARDLIGISGKSWLWAFESQITKPANDTLELLSLNGQQIIFNKTDDNNFISLDYGKRIIEKNVNGYRLKDNDVEIIYNRSGKLSKIIGSNGGIVTLRYKKGRLQLVDLYGRSKIHFKYDKNGLLSRIKLPSGALLKYRYNESGLLASVTDGLGTQIKYDYKRGLLSQIRYPQLAPVQFSYEKDSAKLLAYNHEDKAKTTYTHEDRNGTILFSEVKNGQNRTTYTLLSEKWVITNAQGISSEIYWHKQFPKLVSKRVFANGRTNLLSYDNDGQLTRIENETGVQIHYEYLNKNIVKIVTTRGTTLSLEYDVNNNLISFKDDNGAVTNYSYTKLGQLGVITQPNGRKIRLRYYSNSGLLSRVILDGVNYQYKYDKFYRIKSELIDGEQILSYDYDNKAKTVNISRVNEDITTKISYNQIGLPLSIQSAEKITSYNYNDLGQITQVVEPDGAKFDLTYDEFGNLIQTNLPDQIVNRYDYNQLNQLVKLTDARNNELTYQYNEVGNLQSEQVLGMAGVDYRYDSFNRLAQVDYNGVQSAKYHYNYENFLIKAQRDNHVKTIARGSNNEPRVISFMPENGATTEQSIRDYELKWNDNGQLVEIIYPSGNSVNYQYKKGKLNKIVLDDDKEISFSIKDNTNTINYANGITSVYELNANDLHRFDIKNNSEQTLLSYEYQYDKNGNLQAQAHQYDEKSPQVYLYGYDQLNRLISIDDKNNNRIKYFYDQNGNRRSLISNNGNIDYQYQEDLLTQADNEQYRYDQAGNVIEISTQDDVTEFTYSPRNELLNVNTTEYEVSYQYDAQGYRVVRKENNNLTQFDYIQNHRVSEESEQKGIKREYIYAPGIDQLIAMREIRGENEQFYYYHQDRLNSTVLLTDEDGEVANRYAYTPFGEEVFAEEKTNNAFRYTGRYKDKQTGLYDYRTRFYDPKIGRFISQDKYPAFAAVPASYNRYSYVFNNPNKYRDPNGEFLHIVVGGAIGAGVNVLVNGVSNVSRGEGFFNGGWRAAAKGGINGAVGVGTAGLGIYWSAPLSSLSENFVDVGFDVFQGKSINWKGKALDFAMGTVTNFGAGVILKKYKLTPKHGFKPKWASKGQYSHDLGIGYGSFFSQLDSLGKNLIKDPLNTTHKILIDELSEQLSAEVSKELGLELIKLGINENQDNVAGNPGGNPNSNPDATAGAADSGGNGDQDPQGDDADADGGSPDEISMEKKPENQQGGDSGNVDGAPAEDDDADSDGSDADLGDEDNADSDAMDSDTAEEDKLESDDIDSDGADEDSADTDDAESDAADEDALDEDQAEDEAAKEDEAEEKEFEDQELIDDDADTDESDKDGLDADAREDDEADSDDVDKDIADFDAADEDLAEEDAAEEDEAEEDAADEDKADEDKADEDKADKDEADKDAKDSDKADKDAKDTDKADKDDKDTDEAETDDAETDDAESVKAEQAPKIIREKRKKIPAAPKAPSFKWNP